MKKERIVFYSFISVVLILGVFISSLLVCGGKNCFSLSKQTGDIVFKNYFQQGNYVYVGGAVKNSGWFFIKKGATYADLLLAAGELEKTAAPSYVDSYASPIGERRCVIFDYKELGVVYPSININSSFFSIVAQGRISIEVVEIIENYKRTKYFTSIGELEKLLGREVFLDVFYKLHIGENI